jgi:ribonuclease HI/pterin-4a-carbinolamine dehydratase
MWQNQNGKLYQKFVFKDFKQAVVFMNKVADIAEELGHHPKIHNNYNTVELWLSTHDAGDVVTEKDQELADRISQIVHDPLETPATVSKTRIVKLYGDGGSRGNPGPSASGYVIMDMDGHILFEAGVYLGITTNNQAEYQALKFGLEQAKKMGAREVHAHMDSLLVINQMKGVFKVKNRDLWPIFEAIKTLVKDFEKVTFTHVPRELNKLADAEVNKCLDAQNNS